MYVSIYIYIHSIQSLKCVCIYTQSVELVILSNLFFIDSPAAMPGPILRIYP